MVEEWSSVASYSSFFTECNPSYCTYLINERPGILIIVTTLISIFSGLNLILKLLIPLIVRVFYWCSGHAYDIEYYLSMTEDVPHALQGQNLWPANPTFCHKTTDIYLLRNGLLQVLRIWQHILKLKQRR